MGYAFSSLDSEYQIIDVILFYDFAQAFTCYKKEEESEKYYAYSVDENEEGIYWILVPITDIIQQKMMNKVMSIREVIFSTEDKCGYRLFTPFGTNKIIRENFDLRKLTEDELPEDFYVESPI